MRRRVVFGLLIIIAGTALVFLLRHRSTAIQLSPSGYSLTYTVSWGLGMDEKFDLRHPGGRLPSASSGWLEIWDKPYNGVLSVYRSVDGETYYFGMGPFLNGYTFQPFTGVLKQICKMAPMLNTTALGTKLRELQDRGGLDEVDPGAPRLRSFLRAEDLGDMPASPPRSRYYADLYFLGRFGVVQTEPRSARGVGVGFSPANKIPEPRFGLAARCD